MGARGRAGCAGRGAALAASRGPPPSSASRTRISEPHTSWVPHTARHTIAPICSKQETTEVLLKTFMGSVASCVRYLKAFFNTSWRRKVLSVLPPGFRSCGFSELRIHGPTFGSRVSSFSVALSRVMSATGFVTTRSVGECEFLAGRR